MDKRMGHRADCGGHFALVVFKGVRTGMSAAETAKYDGPDTSMAASVVDSVVKKHVAR
jgi:hypothetical protein